ncbi:MAG: fused MFS/spermidine synthase [Candidatus Krumholzibacteriaceae bacterium]|jgi:predicted membrane-bound spermidine synthase
MKRNKLYLSILVVGVAVLAAAAALIALKHARAPYPAEGLVFKGKSPSGEVCVLDDGGVRRLLAGGAIRAAVDSSLGPESALPCVNVLDVARDFHRGPGRLLLIGLGAGSVAKHYQRAGWSVDVVEPDPLMVSVAGRFFGFDSTGIRVFRTDGRMFIAAAADTYDVIVVDAFGSGSVPLHLLTKEAFDLLATRLAPGGTLAVDVRAVGWHDPIVHCVAATLAAALSNVLALPIAEPPDQLGNVILFASRRALVIPGDIPVPTDRFTPGYDRFHAWENRFSPDIQGARVATDRGNPLGGMIKAVNVRERRLVRELFTRRGAGA